MVNCDKILPSHTAKLGLPSLLTAPPVPLFIHSVSLVLRNGFVVDSNGMPPRHSFGIANLFKL